MPHLIPIEDFFRNPAKTRFQISPNGEFISFMAPWKNRLNVFTQKFGNTEIHQVTQETERNIAGYFWGSDNRILFLKDKGGDENYHLYSVSIEGNEERDLTPFEGITVQIIDHLYENQDEVIIGMNQRNKEIFDAYRLNIHTGNLFREAENPGNITDWITDHSGEIRIAITTDGVNQSLLHRKSKDDLFQSVITTNFRESISPLFFTFDNKNIYALSNIARDKAAIVLFDLEKGIETEVLFTHEEVDLESLLFSRKRKVLTSYSFTDWKRHITFLDPEAEEIYSEIGKIITDDEVVLTSQNKNETRFLVRSISDRSLGAYYMYDVETKQLQHLADVSDWLKKEELASMKPISYLTEDGFKIHGYLTLPKNSEAKNLPVVVNPHGGPWV
ncbi:MAG: S9 family peptidase, partial [Chitinophagales bacterium]|nr:S9 family peptidase [Chitinophagales bacterium]